MFILKIATTIWLTLIAFGMASAALNKKVTVSTRLLSYAKYLAERFGKAKKSCTNWHFFI